MKRQKLITRKLNCILVDDDPFMHQILTDQLEGSPLARISHSFTCPKEFLKKQAKLEYDLCLLDIAMPEMDGLMVAELLDNKPIIFITGFFPRLQEALAVSPIDIVTKPIVKYRMDQALAKAIKFLDLEKTVPSRRSKSLTSKKEYELFNIAEADEKIRLCTSDIFFVEPDTIDPRNKMVIMRNGEKYTIMDCTFEHLLSLNHKLVKVNKSELISVEAVHKFRHDVVVLKCLTNNGEAKHVTLNRSFRENFSARLVS